MEAKIDASGIGSQETRHPRWERCRALWSALERPVCFQGFNGIAALGSAGPLQYAMFEQLTGEQKIGCLHAQRDPPGDGVRDLPCHGQE